MSAPDWKWLAEKLERMDERLDSVDKTLAVNTESLREHIKRTSLLEAEVKPIKQHVQLVNGMAKISVVLIGVAKSLGLF